MKGNHKANMARIDNLEKYMRIFREGNSAVSEEWFAHNGSWDRFSSSTCTHNLPHS
jgi:hypothetical protein